VSSSLFSRVVTPNSPCGARIDGSRDRILNLVPFVFHRTLYQVL